MDSTKKWGKRALVCATILGVCVIIYILTVLFNVLSTPISIILWTIVFVFLLRGIVNKFEQKGLNRVVGTLIAYIIMILIVGLVLLFMFSPAFGFFDQISNIIENIPKYIGIIV